MHAHPINPVLENMHACQMLMHMAAELLHVLQVGSRFACASHKQGQRAFAWNRLLRDCRDDEERQLKQAEMDASIKALHYRTGHEVCTDMNISSSIPYAHQNWYYIVIVAYDYIVIVTEVGMLKYAYRIMLSPSAACIDESPCCKVCSRVTSQRHINGRKSGTH